MNKWFSEARDLLNPVLEINILVPQSKKARAW